MSQRHFTFIVSSARRDGNTEWLARKAHWPAPLRHAGANFIGALMVQNDLGDNATVTTVFPDDNKKYLSTDLLRKERPQEHYLAPQVELLSYEAFKRVCYTCFDAEE